MRRLLFPILILTISLLAAWLVPTKYPNAKSIPAVGKPAVVSVVDAQPRDFQASITAYGTVTPRTQIDLVAEVSGKVVGIAPDFATGSFFGKGQTLVTIDPREYELSVTRSEAQVLEARQQLRQAEVAVEIDQKAWRRLSSGDNRRVVDLQEIKLAKAQARLTLATVDLELARLQLGRTEVQAPFAGRVRSKNVGIGKFVTAGELLAQVYSIDVVEIRLPIEDRQLRYIELPLDDDSNHSSPRRPHVEVTAEFAGQHHAWQGSIVRTEGVIDPKTRLLFAVAEVANPYPSDRQGSRPALVPGMFVAARIAGRTLKDVYVLPSDALREPGEVRVVDRNHILRTRAVKVLKTEAECVVVGEGLSPGDQVVVSQPANAVVGTVVRIASPDAMPAVAKVLIK